MEDFLEQLRCGTAPDVALRSFTKALNSCESMEEAKESVYALIDAYSSGAASSGEAGVPSAGDVYRTTVMKAIAAFMHFAEQRAGSFTPPDAWQLAMEDHLMLAMFFNELATITQPALFEAFCEAVQVLFRLSLPIVYAASLSSLDDTDAEAMSTQASLRAEVSALRVMMARRLVASLEASGRRKSALFLSALDCLQQSVWAMLSAADSVTEEEAASLQTDLSNAMDDLIGPLQTALHEQLQANTAQPRDVSHTLRTASPLLLAALFSRLEDVFWRCAQCSTAAPAQDSTCTSVAKVVCSRLLGELLAVFQRYLTLQQHKQVESGAGNAGDPTASHIGRAVTDVFRVYSVQRAIQRVLSVALAGETAALVPSALQSGASAAVAAFGGAVAVVNPFNPPPPPLAQLQSSWTEAALTREASTWQVHKEPEEEEAEAAAAASLDAASPTNESRVRPCEDILLASNRAMDVGGLAAVLGDADLDALDDEELALLGGLFTGRDAPLKSSLGYVSATALVDMVMLSLSTLGLMSEEEIQELHVQGLQTMQYEAAKRAQREELERLRVIEQQGVEAIPAGKLIEHVKDSANIQSKGMQALRRPTTRARLERAAFTSILRSYQYVRMEVEARVRDTQALIARCLVQMPPMLADSAVDELFVQLRKELRLEQQQKTSPKGTTTSIVARTASYYQLMLQALYMFAAAQAPIRDRGANPLLLLGGASAVNAEDQLVGLDDGSASGPLLLRSTASFLIDTENPIAFLHEEDTRLSSYQGSRKRQRELDGEDGGGGEGDAEQTAMDDEEAFRFYNDTAAAPCAYSHFLCRVLELVEAAKLNSLLLDVLLQAPMLTRYVWNYLYRQFCLSTDKVRCVIGLWLLTNLASRRPVYRICAVNILLHLCMSTNEYARRLAIKQVGTLLSSLGPDGKPVIDDEAEGMLVRYSKKQLAAIPAYRLASGSSAAAALKLESMQSDADTAAALSSREVKKLSDQLNRHLGLFLMMCVRQPHQLFSVLLDVFRQCVERNNEAMVRLLPQNVDVRRMTQHLLRTDTSTFVMTVLPYLRRHSKDAALLVQSMLWAICDELREMCTAAAALAATDAASASVAMEDYRRVAAALLGHAKAMFETSSIPLGDSDHNAVLHDIRFVAPVLSFIPTQELKQTYLRAFLYFVQVQLQYQRQFQHTTPNLSAKERSYVLTSGELRALITSVIREVMVKSAVDFNDGVQRGMSRVDFFVYLHRAPQESAKLASGGYGGGDSAQPSRPAEEGGVLDSFQREHTAEEDALQRNGNNAASSLPPISVVTTREIVSVCLELTRTFDSATVEKLYGPEEIQKAIKKMMHPPPVPSQLMATVIMAAAIFVRNRNTDFIRFVLQTVLTPLERASTWESDPQLWKGVLFFAEKYYRDCSSFLVNLPDQVLTQALREQPQLCEYFKEEHGNNASFGHILGNL